MSGLIVYYSYKNHTRLIAEKISEITGFDLCEIRTVDDYTDDYDALVDETVDNLKSQIKPDLQPLNKDISNYDTIVVGSPVWWYTIAPPIRTFLSSNNFTGKTVIPFVTHAGWPRSAIKEASDLAESNGANVENSIEIQFTTDHDANDLVTSDNDIKSWINSL
ncbi:MAG: flavodoxin family protein [Methanobrevibacter sp.]